METISTDLFGVKELADELGITPRAIRFYETKGLIHPKRVGTTRVYDHRERARLKLILRGKRLGFSLAEIKEFLDLYEIDPTQYMQLKLLLEKIDERTSELVRQREDLETTLIELDELRHACHSHMETSGRVEGGQG